MPLPLAGKRLSRKVPEMARTFVGQEACSRQESQEPGSPLGPPQRLLCCGSCRAGCQQGSAPQPLPAHAQARSLGSPMNLLLMCCFNFTTS